MIKILILNLIFEIKNDKKLNIDEYLKFYKENGYVKIKNVIPKNVYQNTLKELKSIKTDMVIPFTNIQYGYGNLINHNIGNTIKNIDFIKKILTKLFNKYIFKHLFVHNKCRWVAPDVEWHQEVFNINSFHSTDNKITEEYILNNFLQVYIPLEKQDMENGGLKIIPKAHKEGILKHYDTLNNFYNHKRAIIPTELDKIYKKIWNIKFRTR